MLDVFLACPQTKHVLLLCDCEQDIEKEFIPKHEEQRAQQDFPEPEGEIPD